MKILVLDSRNSIGAWLIKLFTFSKWNHTAVMFEDSENFQNNTVIDVTGFSGVRAMHFSEYKKLYPRMEIIDANVPDEEAGKRFALAQIGKKYDWGAIVGIIFQRRDWEQATKWFCSELTEAIRIQAGRRVFRSDISGVLPRETYAVI
jgi:hypothetical protein